MSLVKDFNCGSLNNENVEMSSVQFLVTAIRSQIIIKAFGSNSFAALSLNNSPDTG